MSVSLTTTSPNPQVEEYYKKYSTSRDPMDSGFDLFVAQTIELPPTRKPTTISFSVILHVKDGNFKIVPRSSISKTKLRFLERGQIYSAGNSYELSINVYVFGDEPVTINAGERYFQLIKIDLAPFKMHLEMPSTLYVKCSKPEILELYKAEIASRGMSIHDVFPLLVNATLEPYTSTIVGTGVHVELVSGTGESKPLYLDLISDGSLLSLANYRGIIDAGYRGELKVPIDYAISPTSQTFTLPQQKLNDFNHAYISAGDGRPFYVEFVEELHPTRRGEGGFGSTG